MLSKPTFFHPCSRRVSSLMQLLHLPYGIKTLLCLLAKKKNLSSKSQAAAAYTKCHYYKKEDLKQLQNPHCNTIPAQDCSKAYCRSLLDSCLQLQKISDCKLVHAHIIQNGLHDDDLDPSIGTRLVVLYSRSGKMEDARQVFDQMRASADIVAWNALVSGYFRNGSVSEAMQAFQYMPQRSIVSWNSAIAGLAQNSRFSESLEIFRLMQKSGVDANSRTFTGIISACVNLGLVDQGLEIHGFLIKKGFDRDTFLGNALVDFYAKSGRVEDALLVFKSMPVRDDVSWNSMIAGFVCNGMLPDAIQLFDDMPSPNVVAWTAMLVGYARSGLVDEAQEMFLRMPNRNLVAWTAMIAGLSGNGCHFQALKLYARMRLEGVKPNSETFVHVLSSAATLKQGRIIHRHVLESQFSCDPVVGCELIDFYARCGCLEDARAIFDGISVKDSGLWNAMIAAYAWSGCVERAESLFRKMPTRELDSWNAVMAAYAQNGFYQEVVTLFQQLRLTGLIPLLDMFALVGSACAHLGDLSTGREIHRESIHRGFQDDIYVANSLVNLYSKCGAMDEAHRAFSRIPHKNTVSWNSVIAGHCQVGHIGNAFQLFQLMPERDLISWCTMISGFVRNGCFAEALNLFRQMCYSSSCSKPDAETFSAILPGIANLGILQKGKEIHGSIMRHLHNQDICVGNSLVDMYTKCGCLNSAHTIFVGMPRKNVISWTAIIAGFGFNGFGRRALQLFEEMLSTKTKPDSVTFTSVLSACCHAGLVAEGRKYFSAMVYDYKISPMMQHYCCMVDLLGRAGLLEEAYSFAMSMPIKPDESVWGSLLWSCMNFRDIKLGQIVAEHLYNSCPSDTAQYVLMSNMYAAAGRWQDAEAISRRMKNGSVEYKNPECSWVELSNSLFVFESRS